MPKLWNKDDRRFPELIEETPGYAALRESYDLAQRTVDEEPPLWTTVAPGCSMEGGWGDDD